MAVPTATRPTGRAGDLCATLASSYHTGRPSDPPRRQPLAAAAVEGGGLFTAWLLQLAAAGIEIGGWERQKCRTERRVPSSNIRS